MYNDIDGKLKGMALHGLEQNEKEDREKTYPDIGEVA